MKLFRRHFEMIKIRMTGTASGTRDLHITRWLWIALVISLLTISSYRTALAASIPDGSSPVTAAAVKLVGFGANPKAGLDAEAIATLVDYVLGPKPEKESALPEIRKATGAYHEFDTRISFSGYLQYTHSSQIPSVLTNPSSLRYSLWTNVPGNSQILPASWKPASAGDKPVIIRGMERNGITPDLTTGVYYEYNLKKTLIHLNHQGRQVLITISNQVAVSDVGKKGYILGNDDDWNYYYSGEPGSARTGLGWIKSYIYDYFSVNVHVEAGASPSMVRSGVFQWIRAGWSGINFAETKHVVLGMKRHGDNFKTILESPRLPAPTQLASTYRQLSALSQNDLAAKYADLQQARKSLAIKSGQIKTDKTKKPDSYAGTPKEQIVQELMLEYLKTNFGKISLLGETVVSVRN
jgi:hypothetical protein